MKNSSITYNWNISHGDYQLAEDIYTERINQIVRHKERLQKAVLALYGITASGIVVILLRLAANINL